jgi:hypothetical protein
MSSIEGQIQGLFSGLGGIRAGSIWLPVLIRVHGSPAGRCLPTPFTHRRSLVKVRVCASDKLGHGCLRVCGDQGKCRRGCGLQPSGSYRLLPNGLDPHPFPQPPVETPGLAIPSELKRCAPRCQRFRRALGVSSGERSVEPSSWSLVTATTMASCGGPCRLRCASGLSPRFSGNRGLPEARACRRQAWPVRLCNRPCGPTRPLGRQWLVGAWGGSLSSYTS